jgi:hypothetical protein
MFKKNKTKKQEKVGKENKPDSLGDVQEWF